MRAIVETAPGVALCCLLALGGDAVARGVGLPVPGAVLGLLVYAIWLASGRGIAWSQPGAILLVRWLGAMIVPALVALQGAAWVPAGAAGALLGLLVVTTLVTAGVTAVLYRLAGGGE